MAKLTHPDVGAKGRATGRGSSAPVQAVLAVRDLPVRERLIKSLERDYRVRVIDDAASASECLSEDNSILIFESEFVDSEGKSALHAARADAATKGVPAIQVLADAASANLEADEFLRADSGECEIKARMASVARRLADRHVTASLRSQLRHLETEVLDNISEDFVSVDANWRVTKVNAAAEQTFAKPKQALIGMNLWDMLPGVQGTVFEKEYRRAMTERVRVHVDAPFEPLNTWFEILVVPQPDGGLNFFARNKAGLKRAEDLASASDRRLRFVMDSLPQKIFTATASGEADYMNPVWASYTGMPLQKILGQGWADFIHPDDLPKTHEVWQHSLRTGHPVSFQHRFRNASGEYRWHLSRAVPLKDDNGRVLMWIGSNTDIHEIKTVKAKLAERLAAEQRHSALLAYVAAASRTIHSVLSVDRIAQTLAEEVRSILRVHQTVVVLKTGEDWGRAIEAVSLSEKYARFSGAEPHPESARFYSEICHSDRPLRLTHENLECQETWKTITSQFELQPPLPMRGCLAIPLVGRGGKHIGLMMVSDKYDGDFTEEDEAILSQLSLIAAVGIENARLYDSLRDQDKRKDEFLATLAHELRNPLAPVRTGLEILKVGPKNDELLRVVGMMERQLQHLVRLVDDLMDISRVSRGLVELRKERVPLQSILNTAIETSRPLIEAFRHTFTVTVADDTLYVNGDLTRLAQVLSNLLNNAARYTPEGGTIELCAAREDDEVVLKVIDTGIGIPKDMLSEVFELFRQVGHTIDRTQGGLGIGLSLVQKLVEMHKGRVWADSAGLGKGSTFVVRLPLAQEPEQPPQLPKSHRREASGGAILVVDDNVDAAEALAMLLGLGGHQVVTAHSGAEAVAAAIEAPPDVVFLDIGLPGMNGYEVARRLREEPSLQGTLLIALTGWGSEDDRRRSKEAGFDHHLIKPVDVSTVSELLERFFSAEPSQ